MLCVGADQVLIRWGVINEDAYICRLAEHLQVQTETFSDVRREDCVLPDQELPKAAEAGIVPLRRQGGLVWAIAPRGFSARQLSRLTATYPELRSRLRLTTAAHLHGYLTKHAGFALADCAAGGLGRQHPALSARASIATPARRQRWMALDAGLLATLALWPAATIDVFNSVLAVWFLAFAVLRLASSIVPRRPVASVPRIPDGDLPVYSVVAALYREATSIAPLMLAIDALDYPREKLDVILVLEADDWQTRAAVAGLGANPHVQVLIAPVIAPKTKPKALNAALPFARGSFLAVFDAEDVPEPGQLRAALDAFRHAGPDVACAQATLCIDNLTHSWLSRMFAAEYAGQFEVLLPGMVALGMPLPLGGSSNHFRTSVLRQVGGWDAWNVTEDADLGFRLARFGYRSVTIAAATSEEAPIRFGAWLRQRSRWMKGWMQTWAVHMRRPQRLWREAGTRGFLALNIVVGGNILTALAIPVLGGDILLRLLMSGSAPSMGGMSAPLHVVAIAAGLASTVVIGMIGLTRQGRLRSGWILLLTPIYWICLSIATWRALWQLWRNPYFWEKTEHGLAKRAPVAGARSSVQR